jgi:Uma2 family endonuclease
MTIATLPTDAEVTKVYSAEEYLALEVVSEVRSEFRNGEIVEMTGGTPAHNKLASACNALLWFALRGKPYSVFVTDQRLWIPNANLYTYPDVMLLPEPVELKSGRRDTFAHYRTIESFQEYLLIAQDRPHVEHYVKQSPNQWLFTEYASLEDRFILTTVSVELSLADLYEAVKF